MPISRHLRCALAVTIISISASSLAAPNESGLNIANGSLRMDSTGQSAPQTTMPLNATPSTQGTAQSNVAATQSTTLTDKIINTAMNYLGVPYRRGGNSAQEGVDCSGLVQQVYKSSTGMLLPRTAREMSQSGEKVILQALKPGDLVFFNTLKRTFSHVGIYIGNGQFVHAPSSGGEVRVESMESRYWQARYNGSRRIQPTTEQ